MTRFSEQLRPPTTYESLTVTTLADGQQLVVPIHRLTGSLPGPTVGLVALLHGDETFPNEIIRSALNTIDPKALRGQIIALPASHGPAIGALSRNSPLDMLDLNRSFPGNPAGWITEQLAHALSSFLLENVDAIFDFHAGGIFNTVDYIYMVEEARDLALSLGFEHNYLTPAPHPGGLLGVACANGIPAVIVELGGGQEADALLLTKGLRAVLNGLKHLGMLEGQPDVPNPQVVFTELATLRPSSGGIIYPEIGLDRLGEIVSGGELLGRVVSPFTFEVLEEMRCPFERGRVVLLRPALSRTHPGDFAYMVGNVDSERPV